MATEFLKDLLELADPLDMDWPEDYELASKEGQRMKNINAASEACNELINLKRGDC